MLPQISQSTNQLSCKFDSLFEQRGALFVSSHKNRPRKLGTVFFTKGTKMRKLATCLVLGAVILSPISALAEYSQASAENYLLAHNSSPWTAMGLLALGELAATPDFLKSGTYTSAIQLTAPILAITAFGRDPRTFANEDLVAKLKSYHTGGQIGDASTLNDDIFGLLALIASGEPLRDAAISDAQTFILNHQQQNGGWGFAVAGSPDSNMTAAAITALRASGVPASDLSIQKGLNYLKTAQNNDGGFTYDPQSEFGTASDSSSTAWVVWALNASSIAPNAWTKNGHSPLDYLADAQAPGGYFRYQKNSPEDAFSPVTTAYAAVALSGKTLPLNKIAGEQKFDFRVEGEDKTVCSGKTAGPTALDVVKNASALCGFTYHIADTSFGPYLDEINDDKAEGLIGWLYLVNYVSPPVGAADYLLQPGDSVLWYYGDFAWQPTRLTLTDDKIEKRGSAEVLVEVFADGAWSPLSGAEISYGTQSLSTGSDGKANISPNEGLYLVYAEKAGYVRSNSRSLQVGSPSGNRIEMSVKLVEGDTRGATLAFVVTPDSLDFGELALSESADKTFTIKNTGTVHTTLETVVTGDDVFLDNLKLDDASWRNYQNHISAGQTENANAKLSVPAGYAGTLGEKSATLTFWAVND